VNDPYKYKYQGQERQDDFGLNWDSFKWRNYDYAIGRFLNVDPLAEDYSYQSPYNFSENRVIDAIELEGLEAVLIHGTTQTSTGHSFSKNAVDQLQRIGGNTERNESFRWNAPLTNTSTSERALAAKQLTSHVTELRNNLIQNGTITADEPITLVGYSHGGNVAIQAADLIQEATGLKVNLLTVSTPAYETHKSLEKAGLKGLEDPNKKSSISSHIQIVHENDAVTSFWAQGNDTYDESNTVHPVTNHVITQKDVSLKGGIKSHTKLPSHPDFAKYLKQIPTMINPNN